MAEKANEKGIIKIETKDPKKEQGAPDTNNGQNADKANGSEEKISFWKHPIKWTKGKFKEHPAASTVVATAGLGVLGFGIKVLAEALGGDKTEIEDDPDEALDDDEEEDEDEEI